MCKRNKLVERIYFKKKDFQAGNVEVEVIDQLH